MTPAEHQQVKDVFVRAVQVPDEQRDAFAREQCGDDEQLLQEVLSLLQHHLGETILETPPALTACDLPAPDLPAPQVIVVDPRTKIDPYLVLSDVWEDNRQILRRRLMIIAYVMAVLVAFSLLRLFTNHSAGVGYSARFAALALSLGCAWLMARRDDLSIVQLRGIEFLVMANTGLLAIVIFMRLMLDATARQDVVTLISVHNWNYFMWSFIIFVYGVFMPNSWQRAAAILIPVATIPAVVTAVVGWLDPGIFLLLRFDTFGKVIPVPMFAAGIAICAAHFIHGARMSAFRAQRLAQYRIERLIGQGGMGQVFEAEHLLLKRRCAIKLIQPEYCADDRALQRFEREVRATAKLTHPHTIEVYDFGQTKDGVFFFAMELLPGMNLRQLVETSGPLPPARAVHFLTEVCEALTEAHDIGLIHRDVKPANIFASQRGGIYDFTKLLDFGVVREVKLDPSLSATTNMVTGTPGFMSPEQITDPAQIDARADIYAVGAVAYYLLTGRPPFLGDSPMEVMLAQMNQTPAKPSTHATEIPGDLEAIIMRCLAKDVGDRFADAQQLNNELQECESAGKWTQEHAKRWWAESDVTFL